MGAISGKEYKRRLGKLKSNVWVDGKKLEGNICAHPYFRGVIQSQSELYDLQVDPEFDGAMTFRSPTTGSDVGLSYLIPQTKEDLEKRRKMIQCWARHTGGLMGRSPDYMNTVLASFAASVDQLEGEPNAFPERLLRFYEFARENDLSFTHTFVNPQNNRSTLAFLEEDDKNARIVKKTKEGLVIRGAKLLATQGGITDEILVFSAPGVKEKEHAYGFSIPTDTKGVHFVARQSFVQDDSSFNSPLSSRFEEMDSVVIFKDVVVPWDRVFFFENIRAATNLYIKGKFVPFALHQITSRQVIKSELFLEVAQKIIDELNIEEYQHVQSKLVEIVKGLETMKALLAYSEQKAEADEHGIMVPSRQPLLVSINQFQDLYPRFAEIVQLLGASGLMTIPTEAAFGSSLGDDLKHYLQSCNRNGKEKVALFRLAWDLTMSSFGSRQTLYERFFFGDPIRLSQMIYQTYEESSISLVEKLLNEKS
ncbi:4-hydroxyphenylacetate 3-monooxygenase, oxygenase component [Halobacillus fulvus]|nr:4-hydroxyphenylacetate 3-monooxygenase, oxygenase component [Halobacillus fulvus]